jgi:hypothetical protein
MEKERPRSGRRMVFVYAIPGRKIHIPTKSNNTERLVNLQNAFLTSTRSSCHGHGSLDILNCSKNDQFNRYGGNATTVE